MKKWTYLVAAGMLLGATPVFTGCIDNDEPEGISLLRGAKAELLKAKASVEAAEALRVQAEAAFLQAQAETEKAVAEFKRAEAEYKKAEAAVKLAEAAYIDAQTEEQKAKAAEALAKAEKMKQQYDLEIKELVAKTEANITWYKSKQAEYEAQYQAALKDIEIAKASLTQEQLDKLAHYNKNVKDAKDKVNAADQEYTDAVQDLKDAMDRYNGEVDDLEKKNELADAVTDAERAVAVAKQNLEEAKEIAALPIEATEWQTKLDELKAQEDALAKEAAKLQVQLGEWKTAHKGEHEAVIEAMTKAGEYTGENNINVVRDEDHVLAYSAFEYEVQNPGALGINSTMSFSIEEGGYFYKDYMDAIENDNIYSTPLWDLKQFENFITRAEGMLKDKNGIEWTKVNLNDLKLDKNNQDDAYEKAYTAWKQAVKAFNTVDGIADPTQLAQAVKVTDAVKAYNAKVAIYKIKSEAVTAAEAAAATAATALTTATDNVTKAKKAQTDYTGTDAIEIGKLAQAVRDAEAAETIAKGNKVTADAAVTTAKAAQTTAWDGDATGKGGAVEAYTNLETAYNEYMNYLNIGGKLSGWNIATTAYGKKAEVAAADINKVVVVDKSTLKNLVATTSNTLYGNFGSESRLVEVSEGDIVNKIMDVINEYKTYNSTSYFYKLNNHFYNVREWKEGDAYQAEFLMNGIEIYQNNGGNMNLFKSISFGKFGAYCQYNKDVAHATAIVENNGTEVKTIIAALKAGKENLEKEIDANNKIVEDLVANFETLKDALEKAYEESGLENAITENQEKINILRPTKHEIQNALTVYLSKQPGYINETSVKELQEALETAVYNAEKTLKDKQVALELAQRNVERYAQGTYNEVEAAQEDLKLKEQALKDAQAELAAANAALKAIIEKLTAQAE